MISIKKPEEIKILEEGGKRLAIILDKIKDKVKIGVSSFELNEYADSLIAEYGDRAAFLGYKPHGVKKPYPASLCVSINDEIVHGIPNEKNKIIKDGDIVSIDLGLSHKGMITDHAITIGVGNISKREQELIEVTRNALMVGINAMKIGGHIGDIGYAIKNYVKPYKMGIIDSLAGHGVGYSVHEDPFVPNVAKKGEGPTIRPGMVIAIEPMLSLGSKGIVFDDDGYTCRTADGSKAAHFEHTVAVLDNEIKILTLI